MIKPEILNSWGPGGWIYYQPQTDWHAPNPLQNSFNQQVANIIAMRKANPRFNLPTDEPTVAAELEAFTEKRWAKTYSKAGMQKFRIEKPEAKKKESSFTHYGNSPLGVVAALAGIDTRALEEWLGAGGRPVNQPMAEERAAICASCPANKKHGWREILTIPAALALRSYLKVKNHMKLETPLDPELGSCQACHCVLSLKVWQEGRFIKEFTSPETLAKHRVANPKCWVLSEL